MNNGPEDSENMAQILIANFDKLSTIDVHIVDSLFTQYINVIRADLDNLWGKWSALPHVADLPKCQQQMDFLCNIAINFNRLSVEMKNNIQHRIRHIPDNMDENGLIWLVSSTVEAAALGLAALVVLDSVTFHTTNRTWERFTSLDALYDSMGGTCRSIFNNLKGWQLDGALDLANKHLDESQDKDTTNNLHIKYPSEQWDYLLNTQPTFLLMGRTTPLPITDITATNTGMLH